MTSFREYLFSLGLAPGTIRMYESMLRRAEAWAIEVGVDLTRPTAEELADLRGRFVESNTTLRQLRCALTHYWEMLEVRQPPVKALRVPRKPRYHWRGLEDEAAIRLVATAATWRPSVEGLVVLVGMYAGLRRAEIATMRWDRFTPDLRIYTVLGKGGLEDSVPIATDLVPFLESHRSPYVYLFPGEKRRHITPSTVWSWTKRIARASGIEHFTTHQMRHTAIGYISEHYGERAAQRFARHVSIETTQIYTRVTELRLREATEALPWLRMAAGGTEEPDDPLALAEAS